MKHSSPDRRVEKSGHIVLGAQYFMFFGVLGIFLPYFNLYCYHLGFSGFQIGTLSSLRTCAIVMFSLLWGALADRYKARKSIYVGCNMVSAVIWSAFLYTSDFGWMAVIMCAYGLFYAPIISFLEAFTMDFLSNRKNAYGRIRVWGTLNFIIAVSLLGWLMDHFSIRLILILILLGSAVQAALSLYVPNAGRAKETVAALRLGAIFDRRMVCFLISAFLMLVSHGTYYGFFSIHLEELGYDNTFIGVAWAVASSAEIVVMLRSDTIFNRFSLDHVLIFSLFVAALRWVVLGLISSPEAILLSQGLHAVTYGSFHIASILYVDRIVPGKAKTFGQAVSNAVTYGLGVMTGFFLSGMLFDHIGSASLFILCGGVAFCGGVLFWFVSRSFNRMPP